MVMMSLNAASAVEAGNSDFSSLVRVRWRAALVLSAAMAVAYFGFMGLFAFNKPLLGTLLTPYLSVAMLLGPGLLLMPVVLCMIYVQWANRVYDPAVSQLCE